MITLKARKKKQTTCNHRLLSCLIVKLTCIVYKNISYGNLVFTEQLSKVDKAFWNKLLEKLNLFQKKTLVLRIQFYCAIVFIFSVYLVCHAQTFELLSNLKCQIIISLLCVALFLCSKWQGKNKVYSAQ